MALTAFGSAITNTLFLTHLPTSPRTSFMFTTSTLSYGHTLFYSHQRSSVATIVCSASNKPSNSPQIRYFFLSPPFFCFVYGYEVILEC